MKNYWLTEMVKDTNYKMAPAEQEFVDFLRSIAKDNLISLENN